MPLRLRSLRKIIKICLIRFVRALLKKITRCICLYNAGFHAIANWLCDKDVTTQLIKKFILSNTSKRSSIPASLLVPFMC